MELDFTSKEVVEQMSADLTAVNGAPFHTTFRVTWRLHFAALHD